MKQVVTKEFIENLPNTLPKMAEEYRKAFREKIKIRKETLKRLKQKLGEEDEVD